MAFFKYMLGYLGPVYKSLSDTAFILFNSDFRGLLLPLMYNPPHFSTACS